MELKPYVKEKDDDRAYADERHHDLSRKDVDRYRKTSARRLWSGYSDPERVGMYAPDVPHAAVITPDGRIDPKYLVLPNVKSAFEKSPRLFFLKRADDEGDHPFTIAVDFDGTIAEAEKPFDPESAGEPREEVVRWLEVFKRLGARIIVFTVRGDTKFVREYLKENDIPFDHINENPDQPPGSSGKVFADVYWDDRAVDAADPDSGVEILHRLMAGRAERKEEPQLLMKRTTVIVMAAPELAEAMTGGEDD
jgi:hypothetical protein